MESIDDRKILRPRSTEKAGLGDQRYALLKSAFAHVQDALIAGYPLEAIAVLESLLTDRLGSMVHGSLGSPVSIGHSLGKLAKIAVTNQLHPSILNGSAERTTNSRKAQFPSDVVNFVRERIKPWWADRSRAIHAMAKVRLSDERSFRDRHDELLAVALEGVRVLQRLNAYDIRERERNGAPRPATAPDALAVGAEFANRFAGFGPAS